MWRSGWGSANKSKLLKGDRGNVLTCPLRRIGQYGQSMKIRQREVRRRGSLRDNLYSLLFRHRNSLTWTRGLRRDLSPSPHEQKQFARLSRKVYDQVAATDHGLAPSRRFLECGERVQQKGPEDRPFYASKRHPFNDYIAPQ